MEGGELVEVDVVGWEGGDSLAEKMVEAENLEKVDLVKVVGEEMVVVVILVA